MDPTYGAVYRQLYRQHWWWRARRRFVLGRLTALAPPEGFGPILDIGCGDGLFLDDLRGFGEPEGLEPEAALVSTESRSRHRIHLRPFDTAFDPGHRFGLILMLDVLEHLDDDAEALGHARRLLAPGGRILLTVPALPILWTRHDDLNHHRRRYTAHSLAATARRAGVGARELRYFFHWLVVPKLLLAAAERLRSDAPATPPTIPGRRLNGALRGLCALERRTWGRLPWPVGSSLLLVSGAGGGRGEDLDPNVLGQDPQQRVGHHQPRPQHPNHRRR